MLKCIVIDDEIDAIEILKDYINKFDNFEVLRSFTNSLNALAFINQMEFVDLAFLDIDMPLISGLDLSKALKGKVGKLIFTTAHTKYAFEAFEIEADAYLLKPISFAKFSLTISKVLSTPFIPKLIVPIKEDQSKPYYFYVKLSEERNVLTKVDYQDIIAIESIKNYIKIYTNKGKIITYLTLKEIKKELLENSDFVQIHRSYIISTRNIENIEGNMIKMKNKISIPIGPAYKDDFYSSYLNKNTFKTGRYDPILKIKKPNA